LVQEKRQKRARARLRPNLRRALDSISQQLPTLCRRSDPTQPGHCKILAMSLVAPTIPIISTANFPPQQRDWWLREIRVGESKLNHLPTESIDMIGDEMDEFSISVEEAKEINAMKWIGQLLVSCEHEDNNQTIQLNVFEKVKLPSSVRIRITTPPHAPTRTPHRSPDISSPHP